MSAIRILICGGRDFNDYARCKTDVLRLAKGYSEVTFITGMARGADSLALKLYTEFECELDKYPADWDTFGKSAGFRRNQQMLDEGKPDVVLAYWDGKSRGTQHMIRISQERSINVHIEYYGD